MIDGTLLLAILGLTSFLLGVWGRLSIFAAWAIALIALMVVSFLKLPEGHPDYWSVEKDGIGAIAFLLLFFVPIGLVFCGGAGFVVRAIVKRSLVGRK